MCRVSVPRCPRGVPGICRNSRVRQSLQAIHFNRLRPSLVRPIPPVCSPQNSLMQLRDQPTSVYLIGHEGLFVALECDCHIGPWPSHSPLVRVIVCKRQHSTVVLCYQDNMLTGTLLICASLRRDALTLQIALSRVTSAVCFYRCRQLLSSG